MLLILVKFIIWLVELIEMVNIVEMVEKVEMVENVGIGDLYKITLPVGRGPNVLMNTSLIYIWGFWK